MRHHHFALAMLLASALAQAEAPLHLEPGLAPALAQAQAHVQPYVQRHRTDPQWIVSRLQMYWQDKHTQVFVRNGVYDHAEGTAPVPTVRFTGARDSTTAYATPRLEDVKPYMGEHDLLWLQNRSLPGQPWEWVAQPKSGRIVEAINMRIAELARDAAYVYWRTGDQDYGRFAYDIFDAYMSGLAYREVPIDLAHGHDQTLVGLQSYEVIHEDIVGPLTQTFDYLGPLTAAKRATYDAAFRKWADVILANGVPWNNWNLIKARFVLQIAAVLPAGERERYVRAVVDGSGPRQWSLKRLLDDGYDPVSAMWNESPAYSNNVANDFMECVDLLDRVFGVDLLPSMPVLPRAVQAMPQYLLPNGRMVGFGDTRYDTIRTDAAQRLLAYAERHGKREDAARYAALLAALRDPARAADYQTPTLYAPGPSWLVQRNGPLVISQVGSSGNHAHANGIAMELFAQGLSLAPESGKGGGYFANDYAEYYAQFPAHNTVVVDGMSAYQPMKSHHPLTLQAIYPQSGHAADFPFATFSDLRFIEPESDAEQARVMGTVRLDAEHGYVVDIFRSRRRDGKDRYHDYIYHNLGQSMRFSDAAGATLPAAPASGLSFGAGDLVGYDYWWDRRSVHSTQPLTARFDLKLPERRVAMALWLQGSAQREFFSVQAPPSTAWTPGLLPQAQEKAPLPTLVVRQTGEAWTHPFTAVMEASSGDAQVQAVGEIGDGHALGLRVTVMGGRIQTIMSGDADDAAFAHEDTRLVGRYGIAAVHDGKLDYLFLGHGRRVAGAGWSIDAARAGAAAAVWRQDGKWRFTANQPVKLRAPWPAEIVLNGVRIRGRKVAGGLREFSLPATPAAVLTF